MVAAMPDAHKRPYRHPKYKTAYRVSNWPEYEKSLRDRGDITVWFSEDAINGWTPAKTGKRGAQPVYSDIAIETAFDPQSRLPSATTPNGRLSPFNLETDGAGSSMS